MKTSMTRLAAFWRAAMLWGCAGLALCGGCRGSSDGPPPPPPDNVLIRNTFRIRGFDPALASDAYSAMAVGRIYEGLLRFNYSERPYRLEPALAAAMPTVSEDGRVVTIPIRQGIRFSDDPCFVQTGGRGREVTAADFVYSIKRLADAKVRSPGYWTFRDRIVGLDAFRQASQDPGPTDYDTVVAGLRAPDRSTVRVELTARYPQLFWILAMVYCAVVPREAVAYYGADFSAHPVGTGPFVLSEWHRNYRMVFRRNPSWAGGQREEWIAEGSGLRPMVDGVTALVVDDPSTQWLMFLRGDLAFSDISQDNWDAVMDADGRLSAALRRRDIRHARAPGLDIFYIGFNMDDPVVGANLALRQALSAAFDTEQWLRYYHQRVMRAAGPLPPGVAGADAETPRFPFNLDRARRLLAEAGYPDGIDPATGRRLELTLDLGQTDAATRESSELLAAFMEPIGVVIRPVYNNWPAFLRKIENRQAQMFRLSWIADYPDAQNFLQLFYGPNASPGSNRVNYRNPEYDRLYEQSLALLDTPERAVLYARLQGIVKEDCPWIFMHHRMIDTLYHGWLENLVPHDFPYGMESYYRLRRPAEQP